jgi:hypothetical protein
MSSLVGSAVCPCPDAQAGALKGSASCAAAKQRGQRGDQQGDNQSISHGASPFGSCLRVYTVLPRSVTRETTDIAHNCDRMRAFAENRARSSRWTWGHGHG